MRKEVTRFLEAHDGQTRARFFIGVGLELSVLARVGLRDGDVGPSAMEAYNEMQHCCMGQVNAIAHNIDDLFPADAGMAILYHYAAKACGTRGLEGALSRALKLAMHGKDPRPSKDEKRVLLVCAENELRAMIQRLLSAEGLVVFEAATGPEALEKAVWVEPHLTIVDCRANVLDGPEFLRALRKGSEGRNSRAILLDDKAAPKTRNGRAGKPVAAHIARPFSDKAFVRLVRKELKAGKTR